MATTRTSPPVDARALDSLLQNTLHLHRQLINRQTGHQPPPAHTYAFAGLGPSALESEHNSLTASPPHTHSSPIESGQNNLSGFLSSSSSTSSFDGFDTPQTSTEVNSPKDGLTIPYPIFNESINYTDLVSPDTLPSPEMTPPSTSILTILYNQRQNETHQKLNIRNEGQHQPQTGDPVTVRSPVNVSSQHPPLPPRPPPPYPPRRIKTSLTTLGASQNSKLVRHLIGNQDSPDSNTDTSVIQIHVRYVPKDLWVKVDLPRDIPVHKARDMILSKCRLTSLPPVDASQPPLPSQETSSHIASNSDDCSVDGRMDFKYELDRVLGQHSQLSLDVNDLMAVSRLATMNDIEEGDSNDDSSDDEEAELRAEALMANDDLFQDAPTSSRRLRTISLQGDISIMQRHRRSNSMTLTTRESNDKQETSSLKGESRHTVEFASNTKHNSNSNALNQQQLRRLLSYSSLHSKGGSGSTDSRDSGSCSSSRFSNIPGWSHYRSRQQSQNGIQLQREVLEHGGFLADRIAYESEDQMSSSGTIRSDCVAWKACFGLFWVAAGHWLDDSRMINSYQLQPNCLLELQLRNNYIQLPPPGGQLNYYDHYAEGILYKMSKKSGAVSKLTSHGSGSASKDDTGVWKERWAVLQGTKLFLYHKRKDTTKKVIQLVVPLRITTSVLPINPRHSFKLTQSSLAPLSTTMITLTMSSDPTVPKICFRATSESEINHWTRIFHSLNDTTLHGIPSTIFSDLLPISPPELPQVQSFSPGHRQRNNTGLGEGSRPKTHHYEASGAGPHSPVGSEAFPSVRKRSHTSQGASTPATSTVPSISPLVISNAEAVFSHRRQHTGQSTKSRGSETGKTTGIKELNDKHLRHSSSNSPLGWFGGLTNTNESNNHYRTSSQSSTLVGSGAYSNQLSSPIREAMQYQQTIVVSTEAFWEQQQRLHQEHDRHRRTITDPAPSNTASPLAAAKFKLLSPFYNHPKESRLSLKPLSPDNRDSSQFRLDQALGIRANSSPLLRPTLGSECLDKPAKSLLDSTNSSRSSLTPLYSGYVWLYIPNIPEAITHDDSTGANGTKSNICITKASGRYVKCFAAINDKGQFQWVEVKKAQGETGQDDGGRVTTAAAYMNKTGRRSSSRPSYAIQLSSSSPSTISGSTAEEKYSANNGEAIEVITQPETSVVSSRDVAESGSRVVQASMAHKLRLYFFCIKISPASLAEVMSELSVASTDGPALKPTPSKEAPLSRAQSTPKTRSPLAGIILPPRTTSLPSARTANDSKVAPVVTTAVVDTPTAEDPLSIPRIRAETAPAHPNCLQNSQKFPTWPSMSPLHSDKSRNSRMMKMSRTVSSTSINSTTSTACAAAQESTSKQTVAIAFERERTVSAPPGSYRASQLCRPGFATLGRHDSICSTRSMLQHTTYIRSNSVLTASPAVMASHRALTGAKMNSKEGNFRVLPNSSSAPSLTTSAALASSTAVNSTPAPALEDLKSNVLTLAQDLQKAMLTRQNSISSKSSSSSGTRQSVQSGERPVSIQSTSSCTRPKLSLSETMAVKRASLQESTAATFQSLQHKPSLGNISDVMEECENEEHHAEEQKQRQVLKLMCPFLEQSEHVDAQGRTYVTLKGYTETEEGWKSLHSALERFIDGPIIDQRSALPPEDTLIPSYNSPPIPEMRQSERAQNFWNAKAKLSEAAYVTSLTVTPSAVGNVNSRSESVHGFSSLGHSTKILGTGLSHRTSLQTGGRSRSSTSVSIMAYPASLFQ
ncbi:hypothetical protein BGZ81_005237 [Podila clonocystis]|nr:hypothetical protein BGZ81_005237 [Podila clonocystis]